MTQSSAAKKWTPHPYQRKAMLFQLNNACAALWLDPGLGKTSISLGSFKVLKMKKLARKMLVIAPLRPCYLVWPKEREDWTDFHDLSMTVLHGPGKDQAIYEDTDIYVINPEGLEWLFSPVSKEDKRLRFDVIMGGDRPVLLIDEVTKFKHSNTKRFKVIKPYLNRFSRRWTLTGTCAPNGYLDLFGQMYVCDQGAALGRYISHYRNEYFVSGGYGGYTWTLQKDGEKRIQERLKPLVLRMEAEDYLDMPKVLRNPVYIDMPEEARRIYRDLEEEMFAVLNEEEIVTAMGAAAASIKCRQVANGGLYLNDDTTGLLRKHKGKREWVDLHTAKIDAMMEIVEELQGKPVFIAYDFHHDLERIKGVLGKDVPVLGGKGSGPGGMRHDKMLEAAWNNNELPYLLGHPASIGHGLNLQKSNCADMIIHSDTWDEELYDQLLRRIRRQGNKVGYLRVHHLIVRDTIDENLYASHDLKGGVQKALMNAMKKGKVRK